jgi:hypothetical protein
LEKEEVLLNYYEVLVMTRLLMWDRGLHSFKMVNAAIKQKSHFLGRVPANVKFEFVKNLDDGSYLSFGWEQRDLVRSD